MLPSQQVEITDLGSLHNYRTEIPNIIFHLKLDPWAFKAYCVFKMTAGDNGSCFKSNSRIAEEIGCSVPTLIKLKSQLVEEGLIIIEKRKNSRGGDMSDLIKIVDMWPQNMEYMMKLYPKNPDNDHKMFRSWGGKRDLGGGVNAVNRGSKRGLDKQDHKEQDHKEQQQRSALESASPPVAVPSREKHKNTGRPPKPLKIYACLENLDNVSLLVKRELTRKYDEEIVKDAVEWFIHEKEFKKGPEAAIRAACLHGYKLEKPAEKPDPYTLLARKFKHGFVYKGVLCHLTKLYICLVSGTISDRVRFDRYFSEEKVIKMCQAFGLNYHEITLSHGIDHDDYIRGRGGVFGVSY